MSARIDGWHRTGSTAMSKGQWIIAKVRLQNTWTYEVWHEERNLSLARCKSFEQAKCFIDEWEEKNGLV